MGVAGGGIGTGSEQLASGGPLFRISALTLPRDGGAVVLVELAHLLGDGATFYRLCAALDAELRGGSRVELIWGEAVPPCYRAPGHMTLRDQWRMGVLPMKYAFPLQARFGRKRVSQIAVVDRKALRSFKKADGAASKAGFVSSNDVIMSALAEVYDSTNILMHVNMRGRAEGARAEHAGNIERNIFFPRSLLAARRGPAFLRDVILSKLYYWWRW
mmetsp:Transcript_87022/g.246797  ORF Transcript_87022/g.246797 Transcript_87022/m.246797 type:complete len:216 (-) Transcript_87022:1437-2084(-)